MFFDDVVSPGWQEPRVGAAREWQGGLITPLISGISRDLKELLLN